MRGVDIPSSADRISRDAVVPKHIAVLVEVGQLAFRTGEDTFAVRAALDVERLPRSMAHIAKDHRSGD